MPQVFQALRCFKCLAFQVHQVKKAKKWECKLCGEKQSFKRHYGIGTGKECRLHVQKLNETRGEIPNHNISCENSDDDFENSGNHNTKNNEVITISKTESKWSNYVEKADDTNATLIDEENETLFGKEVMLELPKKCKKVYNKYKRNKKNAYMNNQSEMVYDDDVTSASMPVSTTCKKKIKRFVPPTTRTKSKWTEYNELENISNHTDAISSSNLFDKNTRSNTSMSTNIKTNNYDNIDKPNTNHRVFSNDNDNNINYNNTSVGETFKQNSKWTEFIDNNNFRHKQPQCCSSVDFKYSSLSTGSISNLFSLCDDNDLDSVLNI